MIARLRYKVRSCRIVSHSLNLPIFHGIISSRLCIVMDYWDVLNLSCGLAVTREGGMTRAEWELDQFNLFCLIGYCLWLTLNNLFLQSDNSDIKPGLCPYG